ncbi:phosphodiester glycosidase family protein [Niabella terrae]
MSYRRIYFLVALFFALACAKSDPTEPQKSQLASITGRPGNGRVQLSFQADRAAFSSYEIYWNHRSASRRLTSELAVEGVITVNITNLDAGDYLFELIGYTASGAASAPQSVTVKVYGAAYQSNLDNRQIQDLVFLEGETPYIEWKQPQADEVAVRVNYTNKSGVANSIWMIDASQRTELPDYKPQTAIEYQSYFLPEPGCVDSFRAASQFIPYITRYASLAAKNIVEKSGLVGRLTGQSVKHLRSDLEYTTLQFENGSGNPFSLFIVRADLNAGNLSMTTLMPNNGTAFGLQTVQAMATHKDAAGGRILAAVNADYFDWSPVAGRPWGPVVADGIVIKNEIKAGLTGTSYFGIRKDKSIEIGLASELSTSDFAAFQNLCGAGSNLLYMNGTGKSYNDRVREPRTMIGYTTNKTVYLVVVDGRRPDYSVGMTIDELIAIIGSLGVYAATNLDGGGSSTMVIKNGSGDFEIVNRYSDAVPRAVANGIAIQLN